MQHRKQAMSQIERTVQWNIDRGNTPDTLNWELELAMLQEELNELKEAVTTGDTVGIFDALMDLKFVLIGSCGKFGLTPAEQVRGFEYVLVANEHKPAVKNAEGKIVKPVDWYKYAPEAKLQKILSDKNIEIEQVTS